MKNTWFQFKQFKIQQDANVFKVGTDGCLLGAWANIESGKSILDIGTGTGVIALICAQRNHEAQIQAIEINTEGANQAKANIQDSPWNDRVSVINASLQSFTKDSDSIFDHIVCNPPFFQNSTKNQEESQSKARHDIHLTLWDLFRCTALLSHDGTSLSLIMPYDRRADMVDAASMYGWHLSSETRVSPFPESSPNRVLQTFSRINHPIIVNDIALYSSPGTYSTEVESLFTPFYLHLSKS